MSNDRILSHSSHHELIHQHYMGIINALPDVVYWVDVNCKLLGCNKNFVSLLGIQALRDFKNTPYQLMHKHARWSQKRIETLRLDDMNVIFSGQARNNVEEEPIVDKHGNRLDFKSNRALLFDENNNIIGLVVVLSDNSASKKIQADAAVEVKKKKKTQPQFTKRHLPTVLMIEDNPIAQNVEKSLLTQLNCQVDIAGTGDMALKLFDPGKYDLVLMDIGLGDTSGYVVAKQLRNMEKNTAHHVPIIALTSYRAEVVKSDCEKYFMEGVLSKPLTSEQAEQIIKHYVYHMDVAVPGLQNTLYTHQAPL